MLSVIWWVQMFTYPHSRRIVFILQKLRICQIGLSSLRSSGVQSKTSSFRLCFPMFSIWHLLHCSCLPLLIYHSYMVGRALVNVPSMPGSLERQERGWMWAVSLEGRLTALRHRSVLLTWTGTFLLQEVLPRHLSLHTWGSQWSDRLD